MPRTILITHIASAGSTADRPVLKKFRTGFLGKCSPVHFFWGSFDLAVTRFSGAAPRLYGKARSVVRVMRESLFSRGQQRRILAGATAPTFPAFYSYTYPMPRGFKEFAVQPEAAYFTRRSRVPAPLRCRRTAARSRRGLLAFLQSTYEAAAITGTGIAPRSNVHRASSASPRHLGNLLRRTSTSTRNRLIYGSYSGVSHEQHSASTLGFLMASRSTWLALLCTAAASSPALLSGAHAAAAAATVADAVRRPGTEALAEGRHSRPTAPAPGPTRCKTYCSATRAPRNRSSRTPR